MARAAAPGARRWICREADPSAATELARALECPQWFASFLAARGIQTPDAARALMDPRLRDLGDPFLLPGMDAAVTRIMAAIERGERITVFGDYDVDGISGTALLASILAVTSVPFSTFLPHRLDEGYGLTVEALERCLEETAPRLIVTVDCGTGSKEAVLRAAEKGIDVIITDHHAVSDGVAPALAVVNPRLADNPALHVLAGVGVAFKLCHALLKRARSLEPAPAWAAFDPRDVLDLVALGTIADLVPLQGENRILVRHGLTELNRTRRKGLIALRDVSQIRKPIDTYEVGFLLAPRLNAAGRLGTARTSLQLLLSDRHEEAVAFAAELDAANRERQQVEKRIVRELERRTDERMADDPAFSIVESDRAWHPGVIGIAAARIMHRHHRPAIVIGADDQGRAKGSCRSIAGFNMVEALADCHDLLVKFGGHAMAAGVELEWDRIEAFRQRFEQVARERLAGQELVPELTIDAWIDARDINDRLIMQLERLKPFGIGHAEPLWGCRGMGLAGPPREVGTGHLKANLVGQGVTCEAIGFGLYDRPLPDGPLDAAFHLRRDAWMGRERIVLHLKDFQASTVG